MDQEKIDKLDQELRDGKRASDPPDIARQKIKRARLEVDRQARRLSAEELQLQEVADCCAATLSALKRIGISPTISE